MKLLRVFDFISEKILERSPNYSSYLEEAKINEEPIEFVDRAIFYGLVFSAITFFALYFSLKSINYEYTLLLSSLFAVFNGMTVFLYSYEYPKIKLLKEVYEIEKNLPSVLRQMYIQVSSGVPLYDSLVYIAYNTDNPISQDFREIIKESESGKDLSNVLKKKASLVRSKNYSQFLLQLSDAIKVGTDISSVLKSLIDELVESVRINIKWFKSKMNVVLALYLILALAFPAIALVFINLLNMFSTFFISNVFYVLIFVTLAFFQYTIVVIIDYYKKKVSL